MTTEKIKHPRGLWLVNTSVAIQNFYSYGIASFWYLYFVTEASQNGVGLGVAKTTEILGWYAMIASFGSLFGAWIADRVIGLQKSIIIGTALSSVAYLMFSFVTIDKLYILYASLAVLMISGSLCKANMSTLVGELYTKDQVDMKDEAFAWFYSAVNVGVLVGPILFGSITDKFFAEFNAAGEIVKYGYKYGWYAASLFSLLLLIIFVVFAPSWLKDAGKYPKVKIGTSKSGVKEVKRPLTKNEKNKLVVMAILFVFVTLFWTAYFQTTSSLTLMTQDLVDRRVGGFLVPTPWMTSFNGLLCIFMAPMFGRLWLRLSNSERGDLSIATKMGLGMILTGLSFYIAVLGLNTLGGKTDGSVKMSILWILLIYVVITIGEMFLSPVGLAVFNKLAPEQYTAISMAVWFLTYAVSGKLSNYLAGLTESLSYQYIFTLIGAAVAFFGFILFFLKGYIDKMINSEV